MSDFTIVCKDKTFPVHSAFLCARSNVFKAMLTNETKEAKERKVEIKDVSPEVLELFLRFLYESKMPDLDATKPHPVELYKMAHKYDVQALWTACRLYILRFLHPGNLVTCAILGHIYNDDELKNAATSLMGKEVGPLSDLKNWDNLAKLPTLSLEIADRIKMGSNQHHGN